jgi:opacity protein-like surface antigen
MSKIVSTVVAAAACLSIAAFGSIASAQDGDDPQFVARDKSGNLSVADDMAGFGEKGQWTFSTDAGLELSRRTQDGFPATTRISVFPATDYFVMENLSVGGVIGIEYLKAGPSDSTRFVLGPRVGYNFEISEMLSIWPKLGFSYTRTNGETTRNVGDTEVTTSTDNNAIALNLFAPVMLHPATHFFAGFGPFLDVDMSGDNRSTTWGFRLTLGGWL